jgi:hypothetical protein
MKEELTLVANEIKGLLDVNSKVTKTRSTAIGFTALEKALLMLEKIGYKPNESIKKTNVTLDTILASINLIHTTYVSSIAGAYEGLTKLISDTINIELLTAEIYFMKAINAKKDEPITIPKVKTEKGGDVNEKIKPKIIIPKKG